MKRLTTLVSGTLGLVLLLVPLTLSPWPDPSREKFALEVEKRPPAAWPQITSWSELLRVSTYSQISQALRDRVPLRGLLIVAKNRAAYRLLGERMFGETDAGRDGWLFVRSGYYRPWESEANVTRVLRMFRDFLLRHQERKPEILVVIGPDKDMIYPEQLGEFSRELAAYAGRRRNLIHNFFADNPDLGTLGLWTPYLQAKQGGEGLMFFKYDTHHTSRGTMVMVREMVERIRPGIWRPGEVVRRSREIKVGDLALLGGLGAISETERRYEVVRPGVRLVRKDWLGGQKNWKSPVHYVSDSATRELIGGKTLVLHDSLLGQARETLRQFFKDVTFDHYDNHILAAKLPDDVGRFDRIIVEVAERQFTYVMEKFLMQTNAQPVRDVPADSLLVVNANAVSRKTPEGLEVKAVGQNPGLLMPSLELPGEESYVVRIEMDSSVNTVARLFCVESSQRSGDDDPSVFRDIQAGRNVLYFPVNARQLFYALRFDPAFKPGTLLIRSVQVCALSPRPGLKDDGFGPPETATGGVADLWMLQEPGGAGDFGQVLCNDQGRIFRTREGLQVDTRGNAPALSLPALAADPSAKPVLHVTLESPADTQCQVYHRLTPGQAYTEEQCSRRPVRAGLNRLSFSVPAAGVQYGLRLDPGRQCGQYLIRRLVLGGLKSAEGGSPLTEHLLYPVDTVYRLQGKSLGRIQGSVGTRLAVSDQGLRLEAENQDPALELPAGGAGSSGPAVLRILLESPQATMAQLFYRDAETQPYSEARSRRTDVRPGTNTLYFVLPAGTWTQTIRFDPACHPGVYFIRSIALGLPRTAAGQAVWTPGREYFDNLSPSELRDWFTFRCTETLDAWTPGDMLSGAGTADARLEQPAGRLLLRAAGSDPCLRLAAKKGLAGERFLVRLRLEAPADTFCQLYYTDNGRQTFTASQNLRQAVRRGPNELFFYLEADTLRRPLRLDPGEVRGTYALGPMEIRALLPAVHESEAARDVRAVWPMPH